ncbi:MAG: methyltransferase [Verrucomicrobiae bacterium]
MIVPQTEIIVTADGAKAVRMTVPPGEYVVGSKRNADKELYRKLRALSWESLWAREVPRFDRATPEERAERVAVVRAVGVVFSESGPRDQENAVREWLRNLLADPGEKIRRYAMNALPKVGAGRQEESVMLALLQNTENEREKKFLTGALEKIGGAETLSVACGVLPQTEQKARAAVARSEDPGALRMDRMLDDFEGMRIHLRGRRGLESVVRSEVGDVGKGKFRVLDLRAGLVVIEPAAPFSLADIYAMRCFGTAGFFLGMARAKSLAGVMTSPRARSLLKTFTDGPARYRLDFVSKGHQRGAVRDLANRVYALCPEILNDPRSALWAMDVYSEASGESVELRPRWTPDPRFAYRLRDIPAASHPPLAACMARLAGKQKDEVVWDPFCGSGTELIECAMRGGVRAVLGTDRSAEAIAIAQKNFAAAGVAPVAARWICRDFREHSKIGGLGPGSVSLFITNPPMGMRVPIANLRELIADLFSVAAVVLRPGGRLVFVNPLRTESPHPLLGLQSRQVVDMSGFDCRMEMYVRSHR